MGILPSLCGAFGNKAQLFLEAVDHYEKMYWDEAWETMDRDPDVSHRTRTLFRGGLTLTSADLAKRIRERTVQSASRDA